MAQSLVQNYVHIVFSTKHRKPIIKPPYEDELHAYLGGICKELECPVLAVGGYTNHVHILCMLSRKIALMNLVMKLKANSSKWMKTKHHFLAAFRWQDGYAAFSVRPAETDVVVRYINNQHEHHKKKKTFKQEFREYMMEFKIDYDEKYVWD